MIQQERSWALALGLGGEVHHFIDPTPQEIDGLFRGLEVPVGAISVRQLYDDQLTDLYRLNGWDPKTRIVCAEKMGGRCLEQMVRAERGTSPTLIGPASIDGVWGVQMWVPNHRR
ncbi:hypothetical protein KC992_01630 [Candidatus Saccharibacteria bacterium]|nr:hypothetical protein [Candidatus Saccharibacteria bacterium]MCA9328915.1 hypothetical protein [Candidatus Saccharibacteria bacterium]